MKTRILKDALTNLPMTEEKRSSRPSRASKTSMTETTLPPDVIELIILLTLQLTTTLSSKDATLLQNSDTYLSLPNHVTSISSLLSTYLTKAALPLTRLLHPTTNSSFLHRNIPQLPNTVSALRSQLTSDRQSLTSSRLALTPLALQVLHLYTLCTQSTIRCLETTKHGHLSRHSKTSASLLSLQSQATLLDIKKTSLIARGVVYTPEVRQALRVYGEHLRDGRARLGMRGRDAQRVLRGYGVVQRGEEQDEEEMIKERTMKEIARVWGEMETQVEGVRRDIERLRGR